VSDYLPEGQRGQYLGWRSRVISLAGVSNLAFCGLVLSLSRKLSQNMGFMALFMLAALFRIVSLRYMTQMADVPVSPAPPAGAVLRKLIQGFRKSNMVRFVSYVAAITFATQLAAPYFSVYMLKDLGFGYAAYTCVQLASVVAGLLAFPIWGRHADRVGNAKIMQSASWLVPLVPFFWAFARGPVSLIIIEACSGFIWSGFTLASANFIYDAVAPALRVRALAYYNLLNGAAVFLGASLGGWLAERLPPTFGRSLVTLFLISAALRLAAHFLLSNRFREVRESVERVQAPLLFLSVLGLRPLTGENTEPPLYPPLRPPRRRLWDVIPASREDAP
jgi:predicted MFS family arabinose efflux permease